MIDDTEAGPQTDAGLRELGMIEQVEYLSTKLQRSLLGYVERLVG